MTNVKIKRIIKFMIVTLVILTTAWICAVISTEPTAYAKSDFAQGDGTKENPFVVTNVDEFNAVATRLDAYFVQGANIDFTGREFFPIGDLTHPFEGHYDGRQYLLTGIEANYPNKDYVGVFSFVYKGATVKNVRVENSTFVGGQNVGAIAGMNAGRIENSVANSDVTANSHAAGGITGVNSGYINCSVNGGNVKTSGMYAGGISGVNTGSISDIYNKGSVSAQTYVGGIVGLNNGTNGNAVVERAFQLGQISGNVKGNVSGDNMNAAIKQCRHIQGSDIKNVSAFNNGGSVSASAARPAYEFKSKTAFSDWTGFDNNFMFVADVNHPILKAEYVKVSGIEFAAGSTIKLRPGEEIRLGERVVPSHTENKIER